MPTLKELSKSIQQSLAEHRIGPPAALRLHAFVTAPPANDPSDAFMAKCVAEALAESLHWFKADVARLDARSSVGEDSVTVLAELTGGGSALVSAHRQPVGPSRLDLLLLGSQGAIRYDHSPLTLPAPTKPRPADSSRPGEALDPVLDKLTAAVSRSCSTKTPVAP
ncbi:MAG: hypothetical protein ACRC1K_19110 [Planctomycetia bacterium]